jgi:spore coat protein U-like protein
MNQTMHQAMLRRLAPVALFLLVCGVRPAAADSCQLSSIAPIVFGSYTGSAVRVAGTITFQCSSGSAYSIGLNAGTTGGSTVNSRNMSGPSSNLGYSLFSNAGYNFNWGDSSGTNWVTGMAATNGYQAVTIYAQLPTGQYPAAGTYTDTVTATLSGNFATSTLQFNVSATVVKACLVSASSLLFGAYTGSVLNSTAIISANCTNGTAYNVGLDAGTANAATVTNRSMTGPSSILLRYSLFSDSGRSMNWGNTVGSDTLAGTGTGVSQYLTVYGQIPAGQTSVVAGSYADTVTVTLTY